MDFGAYPRFCSICKAIRCGKITGDNRTIGFWKHNVVRAIHGCTHGIQVTRRAESPLAGGKGNHEFFLLIHVEPAVQT